MSLYFIQSYTNQNVSTDTKLQQILQILYISGPEVLFKTCIAMKFMDDDDDHHHQSLVIIIVNQKL